ncbi:MAG TPA: peptide-N-glycosidase F-related protein [Candidatus Kapabacteria bacterium]|nr:peptide-N-glycosidase F-related protein [Candidatus Kapabacteria bacterium]
MNSVTTGRLAFFVAMIAVLSAYPLHAQPGSSVVVQTFTYGSPSDARFVLPPLSEHYEKVLMHYKLRCPLDAQCGEWDYLMYIYLFQHTGQVDSTIDTAYHFRVDNQVPDSVAFMRAPSWHYFPRLLVNVTRTSVTSFDSATIANPPSGNSMQLTNGPRGRLQFLWSKTELLAAGLKAGDVTGIRFNVTTGGQVIKNLMVRMKASTRDSLTPNSYETDGFTTCYLRDVALPAGWQRLDFPTPFTWNGTSNIAVDVSYDQAAPLPGTMIAFETSQGHALAHFQNAPEQALHFEGRDYIDVPANVFNNADSAITIGFWAYGNPLYQPQEQSIFEGVNKDGQRVLNLHLPWSDGTVYWDAGNAAGAYDRLSKAAGATDYKGKWSYWTVTKNVKAGTMKIYLNGVLFTSTGSKKKPMGGITRFRIGSGASGDSNYDGNVDEFAVWNAELDATTIKSYVGRELDNSHPFRANLRAYYKFGGSNLLVAADSSGNGFDAAMTGPPAPYSVPGAEFYLGMLPTAQRPHIIFEQGKYTSTYDTTVAVDSVQADPLQVVLYRNTQDSTLPDKVLTVWPAGYNHYAFNRQGVATDSSRVTPDSVIHQTRTPYFRKFEIVNRFELGRYITPYGNGLSLGEGFTWTYDVSDFRPLLHDTVHLNAYNQQELVDMTFEFVRGTPPRDPISVTNLWNGGFSYGGAKSIEDYLHPLRVKIPENAANTRIRVTPTGHGFGGNENCSEFCAKDHTITVDGTNRFQKTVWRDNCNLNPVYPQGGTWVYSRSNWCPGAEVWTYNFELTPWVHPGDSVTLDYNITPYTWNGQGSTPYYQIETQLVTYGPPNFSLDAAVVEIKAPGKTDLYKRMNPICSNPLITIRNTGSTPLTSLDIQYGVQGAAQSVYHWTGQLDFMESADVQLGEISWSGATGRQFTVAISKPNGGDDQYEYNNTATATYDVPPVFPKTFYLELHTNDSPSENSYQLKDAVTGRVVLDRNNLDGATYYRDTLTLPDGCYEFRLVDLGGDGLSWWANTAQGTGSMRIRRADNGATIRSFNADFGGEIYQQFTVGFDLAADAPLPGIEEHGSRMEVYPNPTDGEFTVNLWLRATQSAELTVTDMLGNSVHHAMLKNVTNGSFPVDLRSLPSGAYVVAVRAGAETLTKKIVVR